MHVAFITMCNSIHTARIWLMKMMHASMTMWHLEAKTCFPTHRVTNMVFLTPWCWQAGWTIFTSSTLKVLLKCRLIGYPSGPRKGSFFQMHKFRYTLYSPPNIWACKSGIWKHVNFKISPQPLLLHYLCFLIICHNFLSDPGIPGRICGSESLKQTDSKTFCRLNWYDSGWWWYQIDTNW